MVEKILLGKNLTILTLPYKTKAAGLEKVNFTNILVPKLTHKLKGIQVMSLVFRNFVCTFFVLVFVQSKRVVVGFYLPNSRFQ